MDQGRKRSPYLRKVVAAIVAVLLVALALAVLFPLFAPAQVGHRRSAISLLKQIVLGLQMYADDHDGRLALAESWMDDVHPYIKNDWVFHAPTLEGMSEDVYGFAFFKPLSGVDSGLVQNPDTVPLVFQSSLLHRNAASGLETLPDPPRVEGTGHYIGFLDGHVKWFAEAPEFELVLSPEEQE